MKLGIIQEDPRNANSLKIVNQDTGEGLERVLSYNINRSSYHENQVLTIEVSIEGFPVKPKSTEESIKRFFDDTQKTHSSNHILSQTYTKDPGPGCLKVYSGGQGGIKLENNCKDYPLYISGIDMTNSIPLYQIGPTPSGYEIPLYIK